jgi:hypothetical protein
MNTQFNHVTITISAESPVAAYNRLCDLLGAAGKDIEWTTTTYEIEGQEAHDTEELFPQ